MDRFNDWQGSILCSYHTLKTTLKRQQQTSILYIVLFFYYFQKGNDNHDQTIVDRVFDVFFFADGFIWEHFSALQERNIQDCIDLRNSSVGGN